MNNLEKIQSTLEFYETATMLKYKIRQGWIYWDINKERIESVAEHIYGTCILAISIHSQFDVDIDIDKVVKMLTLHELEEVIIGDITPFDNVTLEEKAARGKVAVEKILDTLIKKEDYLKLIEEFEAKETKEAEFAYLCDKLECNLQIKAYDNMGVTRIENQEENPILKDARVKKIIEEGAKTVGEVFYNFDRPKFLENKIFLDILDHLYK